jgi:hypothetical protein
VVTLTKHRGFEKPEDEQLHVLPMCVLDYTDEDGGNDLTNERIRSGAIEVLQNYPMKVRMRAVPLLSKKKRQKLAILARKGKAAKIPRLYNTKPGPKPKIGAPGRRGRPKLSKKSPVMAQKAPNAPRMPGPGPQMNFNNQGNMMMPPGSFPEHQMVMAAGGMMREGMSMEMNPEMHQQMMIQKMHMAAMEGKNKMAQQPPLLVPKTEPGLAVTTCPSQQFSAMSEQPVKMPPASQESVVPALPVPNIPEQPKIKKTKSKLKVINKVLGMKRLLKAPEARKFAATAEAKKLRTWMHTIRKLLNPAMLTPDMLSALELNGEELDRLLDVNNPDLAKMFPNADWSKSPDKLMPSQDGAPASVASTSSSGSLDDILSNYGFEDKESTTSEDSGQQKQAPKVHTTATSQNHPTSNVTSSENTVSSSPLSTSGMVSQAEQIPPAPAVSQALHQHNMPQSTMAPAAALSGWFDNWNNSFAPGQPARPQGPQMPGAGMEKDLNSWLDHYNPGGQAQANPVLQQ